MRYKSKYKKTNVILFIGLLSMLTGNFLNAQSSDKIELKRESIDTIRFYTSLDAALRNPDQVIRLKLEGERLKEVPEEIKRFKNLRELNLNNNKIKEIPDWLAEMDQLERLNIGDNKLKQFPHIVGSIVSLKRLRVGDNNIDSLPGSLAGLKKLEFIDVWANPISYFDSTLNRLDSLKYADLRVIMLSPDEQTFIAKELWPNATVVMDRPCDCK